MAETLMRRFGKEDTGLTNVFPMLFNDIQSGLEAAMAAKTP